MARKDAVFAVAAGVMVAVGLVLGFWQLGGRTEQRELRADIARVNDLRVIAQKIHTQWLGVAHIEDRRVPVQLAELKSDVQATNIRINDPITGAQYEYVPKTESQYDLCAIFAAPSTDQQRPRVVRTWEHPQGRHCFQMDARLVPPPVAQFPY